MKIILYNDKIIITYNFTSLTPIKTHDTMLKEVEEIECEINKQLDTAIKNGNVSYKNSCLPPSGSRILTVMLECDFSISALQVLQGLLYPLKR